MKKIRLTHFIALLGVILLLGCTEKAQNMKLLVGTYTGKGSEGIYAVNFDPETGKLSDLNLLAALDNPSYVSISRDRRYVYSVGERASGAVFAFSWDQEGDTLLFVNKVSAQGINPCYVDFSDDQKMVAAANYSSGNVAIFKVGISGSLMADPVVFQHEGAGPDPNRQEAPHAHCAIFSKDNRFVYVVDLGIDEVMAYPIANGTVSEGFPAIEMQPGDGPRHLVFHPEKDYAFIINELSSSVVSVKTAPQTGRFEEIDRLSTLPDGYSGENKCADIRISADGRFLYASNRGHNSIAIFSVSEAGELERVGIEPVQGEWPRNFTLSPDGKFLLVANRNTNNITVFSRDQETGSLTFTGNEITVSEPVCLKF